jgi:hypothetical protein
VNPGPPAVDAADDSMDAPSMSTNPTEMNVVLTETGWAVTAMWLGQVREVFTSTDLFACIRFCRDYA